MDIKNRYLYAKKYRFFQFKKFEFRTIRLSFGCSYNIYGKLERFYWSVFCRKKIRERKNYSLFM